MVKEKILRFLIFVVGIISLIIFITTKSETLMRKATSGMFDNGDLYRFAKVLFFKTQIPPMDCGNTTASEIDPDTAEIIVIGDSFMESCRGHKRFPAQISERLAKPVCAVYAGWTPEYFDPVYYFRKNNLHREKRRVVILERVERYIIYSFDPERYESAAPIQIPAQSSDKTYWGIQKRRWFTEAEKNYEVFLKSSSYTTPVVEVWNTFRFIALKQISSETPVYSLNPPFLFEAEESVPGNSGSFYYPHTDELIAQIADNIAAQKEELLDTYNAELVFMPVPNPYTLYHTFINNDPYDNFLPRLYAELEKRDVRTIQLYQKYRDSKSILYFPTDSHWNAEGVKIAVDQAVEVLSQIVADGS